MKYLNIFRTTLLMLVLSVSWGANAQTNITLPTQCNTCTAVVPCTAPTPLSCDASATISAGGTATSTVTGGTGGTITWAISPTTGVSTASGNGATTGAITFATAGTYTVTFTSTNNSNPAACSSAASVTCTRTITVNAVGSITALDCAGATHTGTLTGGTAASGVSSSVAYTGGNSGPYTAFSIASTGITGLTASIAAGSFATGAGTLTVSITGTPSGAGTATFALNIGGQSCNLTRSVVAAFNPATLPDASSGTLAGMLCFDIAESNDNVGSCGTLASRTGGRANFNQTTTNTQTYTFTPSSAVSNVRFYFVNTNGQVIQSITGNNSSNNITTPQTATVVYNTALSSPNPASPTTALALGKTSANPLAADIYVVFNNNGTNTGTDQKIKLTANIKDCACCGAMISPTVWKQFLCYNLGANTTIDPHNVSTSDAWRLQGGYIQHGKRGPNTTGDSRVDWQTAANTSEFAAAPTLANPNEGDYIGWGWSTTRSSINAWLTSGGAKTANDPCPTGYRVPTYDELLGVKNNNAFSRSGTWPTYFYNQTHYYGSALHIGPNASTKTLTLPAAGFREVGNGRLYNRGNQGVYWVSTDLGVSPVTWGFYFDGSSSYSLQGTQLDRLTGASIRCIAQ